MILSSAGFNAAESFLDSSLMSTVRAVPPRRGREETQEMR